MSAPFDQLILTDVTIDLAAANVDALERARGWLITATEGSSVTMTYRRSLELFFAPAPFTSNRAFAQLNRANSAIGLAYVGDDPGLLHRKRPHYAKPVPMSTNKRFFLQILRAQLQSLSQPSTRIPDLLAFISRSWDLACVLDAEIDHLSVGYITDIAIVSDERLQVTSSVLLEAMRTKVLVNFNIRAIAAVSDRELQPLRVSVKPTARVVYGEALKEGKMTEFMESRIEGWAQGHTGGGLWSRVVKELEDRCCARGKRP